MKPLPLLLCIWVLSPCSPARAEQPSSSQSNAQISFGVLKSLAGTWTGAVTTDPHKSELEGPIQATMRVASGGNLLVHEIAPGGMPEPTMIYLEKDRLTLVHYCEAGNRPRMVARKAPAGKTVEFDFVDISGSKTPVYLNQFVFTKIDADHHTEDWTFVMPGDKLLHAHFDLTRAKNSTPPPAHKE